MWKGELKEQYWWARVRNELEELLYELSKAEDEEQTGLYLLHLHFDRDSELEFFGEEEREEIKKLLSILIKDTVKHCDLLANVVLKLEKERDTHAD